MKDGHEASLDEARIPVHHQTKLPVRIVLVVLWAALAGIGMWLVADTALHNGTFVMSGSEVDRLESLEPVFGLATAISLAAATLALAFRVRWWQALLIASPALTYPISEIAWSNGLIWVPVSFVALVVGSAFLVMQVFDLGATRPSD